MIPPSASKFTSFPLIFVSNEKSANDASRKTSEGTYADLPERFLFHVLEYIRIEKCRQIDFKAVADFLNRGHVGGIVPAINDIADR